MRFLASDGASYITHHRRWAFSLSKNINYQHNQKENLMKDIVTTHSSDSIEAFVRALIPDKGVDANAISCDASLEYLGLDSLEVVELSQSVKKQLDLGGNGASHCKRCVRLMVSRCLVDVRP